MPSAGDATKIRAIAPKTRYAQSGDVSIAYQIVGEGPIDLVYTPGFVSNVELCWKVPQFAEHKVGGIAVRIGARVASRAGPGEVLVSSTVKDLVAGSGITFDDRGAHELKGIDGAWQLYAVTGVS